MKIWRPALFHNRSSFIIGFLLGALLFGSSAYAVSSYVSKNTSTGGFLLCANKKNKAVTFPNKLSCPSGTIALDLGAVKGQTGAVGDPGQQGPSGPQGPAGLLDQVTLDALKAADAKATADLAAIRVAAKAAADLAAADFASATAAAEAATTAANGATEVAQSAANEVADLSAKVAALFASLKAQLTALANLVIKIQTKVEA